MGSRRVRRLAVVASIVATMTACGLGVVGVATNEVPATGTDATTPEAAADDVTSEAAERNEAAVHVDAAPADADADADAAPAPTFCMTVSPTPTFCADFDDPIDASVSAGWDTPALGAGATVTASTSVFASGIRSLHATSSQSHVASLQKAFSVTTSLSLDFDVQYVTVPAPSADVSPLLITVPSGTGADLYFFASTQSSYFQEATDDESTGQPSPTLGKWHHVSLSLKIMGSTTTSNGTFDTTSLWNDHTLKYKWTGPTTATISVGVADLYQASSGEIFIDNVVVRAQ